MEKQWIRRTIDDLAFTDLDGSLEDAIAKLTAIQNIRRQSGWRNIRLDSSGDYCWEINGLREETDLECSEREDREEFERKKNTKRRIEQEAKERKMLEELLQKYPDVRPQGMPNHG